MTQTILQRTILAIGLVLCALCNTWIVYGIWALTANEAMVAGVWATLPLAIVWWWSFIMKKYFGDSWIVFFGVASLSTYCAMFFVRSLRVNLYVNKPPSNMLIHEFFLPIHPLILIVTSIVATTGLVYMDSKGRGEKQE